MTFLEAAPILGRSLVAAVVMHGVRRREEDEES
jgi:hypothetical protein